MGGHGGLNILPQKRWNVYRFDNQEKVRVDEAEAAREDQLQCEATRRRESHSRLLALRRNRGLQADSPSLPVPRLHPPPPPGPLIRSPCPRSPPPVLRIHPLSPSPLMAITSTSSPAAVASHWSWSVGPDDEKYKLGYGLAGKGVAAPWYMSKPLASSSKDKRNCDEGSGWKRSGGKKSIEELREERRKREAKEKERELALLATTARKERQLERGIHRGGCGDVTIHMIRFAGFAKDVIGVGGTESQDLFGFSLL